jgi:pimeloyl-ACP methyl ester carboxylesterase
VSAQAVRRRHVFFLSGFDPKGAAYYHGIYARQAAAQSLVTGARYEVGPRERLADGNSRWRVRTEGEGGACETVFEYARWDDIVRAHWPRTAWGVLAGSLRGYRAALASPAALRAVWRVSGRTLVPLAYPALFWLAALCLACALAVLVFAGIRWWGGPAVPAALAASAAGAVVVWAAVRLERRLNTTWLLRIYQFAGNWAAGRLPELAPRLDALCAKVRAALDDPSNDEVLVVGFSVGSMLAMSLAARLPAGTEPGRRLSLLTLGHCIPLLGLMARADAFRSDLAAVRSHPGIDWVDFSSITDWGSFALVDPLALCLGPAPQPAGTQPTMLSPRFHLMFSPERYARIVRDKRRMHMQYLLAGERPALYDFFALTAGCERLARRVAKGVAA